MEEKTCIKTVDRMISFFNFKIDINDLLNKQIKLKRKDLSPTRRWGNRTKNQCSRKNRQKETQNIQGGPKVVTQTFGLIAQAFFAH